MQRLSRTHRNATHRRLGVFESKQGPLAVVASLGTCTPWEKPRLHDATSFIISIGIQNALSTITITGHYKGNAATDFSNTSVSTESAGSAYCK